MMREAMGYTSGAEEDCRNQGIAFLPLIVESLGGWHPVAEAQTGNWGVHSLSTQVNRKERQFPTFGVALGFFFKEGTVPFSATGSQASPHLILMVQYNVRGEFQKKPGIFWEFFP